LWYTDDGQMAIGVAEALVACGCIDGPALCERFAANYTPDRGYGRGARVVLEAMIHGDDHAWLAANHLPGGSFGNGAAMRVAPVGMYFRDDHDRLWDEARRSAVPTHVHPLGVEGAQLLALAVGLASATAAGDFDRAWFFETLAARCTTLEYAGPLRRAAGVADPRDLALFGNGVDATSSVVTAIAAFGLTPSSYERTVAHAIFVGGDTDTIAAMAGAISGAHLGAGAIPASLLDKLEDGRQGRRYIEELARRLHARYRQAAAGARG
jgi:poly(ADP-ribose) glycohydrolase ARH3